MIYYVTITAFGHVKADYYEAESEEEAVEKAKSAVDLSVKVKAKR